MATSIMGRGIMIRRLVPALSGAEGWLSVDPLAHEFSSWTPYHFVHNNPLNLIDPTGMSAIGPGDPDNEFGDDVYVGPEAVVYPKGFYENKDGFTKENKDGSTTKGLFQAGYSDENSSYALTGPSVTYNATEESGLIQVDGLKLDISGVTPIIPIESRLNATAFNAKVEYINKPNRVKVDAGAYVVRAETSISFMGVGLTLGGSAMSAHAGVDAGVSTSNGGAQVSASGHFGFGLGLKVGFSFDSNKMLNKFAK